MRGLHTCTHMHTHGENTHTHSEPLKRLNQDTAAASRSRKDRHVFRSEAQLPERGGEIVSLFLPLFYFFLRPAPQMPLNGGHYGRRGWTGRHLQPLGRGGVAPAGYYDKGCGCITATGELEHQWLYLPSLMGRTENEVSRSVEKYPSGLERTGGKLYSSDCV